MVGKKTLKETAQDIFDKKNLITETAAAETLKPKSQPAEPPKTLGGPATSVDQPHKPVKSPLDGGVQDDGTNAGAVASSVVAQDSSKPRQTAKKVSQSERQTQPSIDKTVAYLEEDIELDEEVKAFIDNLVAEGKSEEEIVAALEENFDLVEEGDVVLEGAEEISEGTAQEDYTIDMTEHVNALFEGEDLSEDFKAKAATIFEAAVKQVVEAELVKFESAYAETLEEEVAKINEDLSTKVDDYLNYVVEQWVGENEVAIDSGLRTELTEDFIAGLHTLMVENYIDVPESKVDVVEAMTAKVAELEDKLNEEINNSVNLTKLLNESKKTEVLNQLTEGLTSTQAEKLKTLSEGIEYNDLDTFETKVQTLRENYFPTPSVKSETTLDKIETGTEGKTMIAEETGRMSKYVKALGRQVK